MKLIDRTVREFTEELASNSPAPGGGSVAAIEGAYGAGLIAMVCELTLGNKKYAEHNERVTKIRGEALRLKNRFLEITDEDTEAFNLVSAAFGMPKSTDEEKALRREAIQNGLKQCCVPPAEVLEKCVAALKLAEELITGFNTSTASDLGTGAASLFAAAQGAYMNVWINAGSIKDEEYARAKKETSDALLKEAEGLYRDLLSKVYAEIKR
ncbi:MAG: cyclodeaminase/cyclohydrolase family protein [Erysipelotrichales bacterium]|nr:cyclodeaminase/cyclohydrolase family protein [Erysipelotrichales bacterium]